MRNWNASPLKHLFLLWYQNVVPYLWGIETLFRLLLLQSAELCCTLPMRNWNLHSLQYLLSVLVCSLYLTYEELKHNGSFFPKILCGVSLYLTYEELKQILCFILKCHIKIPLYLTYEELKRFACFQIQVKFALVVPYLWGIETISSSLNLRYTYLLFRCTLPMRNWNSNETSTTKSFSLLMVVPYLWGIETFFKVLVLVQMF